MNTDWMEDAACRRIPDLPWTAERGTGPTVLADLMADICGICPVREACAEFVATENVTGGYWAGAHRYWPLKRAPKTTRLTRLDGAA